MKPKLVMLPLLLVGLSAQAAVPVDFTHGRDLSGPDRHAPALAEIRLDAAVLAATRPGFPDLRLFDGEFREIPFVVEPLVEPRERVGRRPVAARIGNPQELTGNRFEIRCDLEPGEPAADAVEIRTPLRDFIRSVRVVGSVDGQFWQPLAEAEIYDYSRFLNFRRTVVALPANECRVFQIEIAPVAPERTEPFVRLAAADGQPPARVDDMRQTPFQVGGINFWQTTATETAAEPVLREWPPSRIETHQDREARTTEFILETRRAPLSQIEVVSPAPHFSRLVTVLVPAGERWRSIADGIVSRISVPEFATDDLAVRFPEQRADRLRVVVQHANARPVKIVDLRAYGPSYRLVWIAEPAARYRLAYGSKLVEAAAPDGAPIRAALASGHVPVPWRLSPPPAWPQDEPRASGGRGRRLALWAAGAGAVALGGFLCIRWRKRTT